jgi:hypothetical protein
VAVRALAWRDGVRPGQGEPGRAVIEFSIGPSHRVMASLAGRRESRGGVPDWAKRIVVVALVTRYACRIRDVVVVVDVAIGTLSRRNGMRSG